MKKQKITDINTYLIVALVIVVAIGLYFTLSVPIKEKAPAVVIPPKQVTLTVLGSDCDDCFNISIATDFLKQQENLNVTEIKEVSLKEAKEMTEKYNITRMPALLITGEIENLTIPNFNAKEDALVFDQTPPPFYDVGAKRIKGKVTLIRLEDATCKECFDLDLVVDQMKQLGIKLVSEQTVDAKSTEGKELIETYKITIVPTLIFNKEALEYDVIRQVWSQVGTEDDGKLVLRVISPPYVNVSTGKTEGLVEITYLVDETCTDCFNTSVYKQLLTESFSMAFKKEEKTEVSSTKGQFLLKKYNITALPTVVISKEANSYPGFATAWLQVGTKEKDGNFVFRKVAILESYVKQTGAKFVYKDLAATNTTEQVSIETNATEEAEIAPPSEEE